MIAILFIVIYRHRQGCKNEIDQISYQSSSSKSHKSKSNLINSSIHILIQFACIDNS